MHGFLLCHGLENRRWPGHWLRHLAQDLRVHGEYVAYPQWPHPDEPRDAEWKQQLQAELELMGEAGVSAVTVVAHSLGCVNVLGYLATHVPPVNIDRLILVAPADPDLLKSYTDITVDLSNLSTATHISETVDRITIVASESDPWLPRGIHATFADALGVAPIMFMGAGHISMTEGFGHWKGIYEWCLGREELLLQKS